MKSSMYMNMEIFTFSHFGDSLFSGSDFLLFMCITYPVGHNCHRRNLVYPFLSTSTETRNTTFKFFFVKLGHYADDVCCLCF